MTRPRKPKVVRQPVPAPKMLKVVSGPPIRAELTWKDFKTEIQEMRSKYRAMVDHDEQDVAAAIMVALCNNVLLCPPDDLASTIAVRAAFRLGGSLAQEWNSEVWDSKGIGSTLADAEVSKQSGIDKLRLINAEKSLCRNPDWVEVKKIHDQHPNMNAREIQKRLPKPLDKALLQRWVRDLKR